MNQQASLDAAARFGFPFASLRPLVGPGSTSVTGNGWKCALNLKSPVVPAPCPPLWNGVRGVYQAAIYCTGVFVPLICDHVICDLSCRCGWVSALILFPVHDSLERWVHMNIFSWLLSPVYNSIDLCINHVPKKLRRLQQPFPKNHHGWAAVPSNGISMYHVFACYLNSWIWLVVLNIFPWYLQKMGWLTNIFHRGQNHQAVICGCQEYVGVPF